MTEQDSRKYPYATVSRRSLLQSTTALLSVPLVAKATAAFGQEKLAGSGEVVVHSYGGSFTETLRKNVFDPFSQATGIRVVDVTADLAEPQIKAMNQSKRVDWDVAFISAGNYPELQEAGTFMPIDYSLWNDEALKGVPDSARLTHAVLAFQSTTLLVYDKRAFPKGGPKSWADFWNVKEFPGPRGIDGITGYRPMSFALSADGVAYKDIWPLTEDKIDQALKKLDEIKPHITKWWMAGGEPIQLLMNGEYVMTSAPDGRAITAIKQGAPIQMVWDGAAIGGVYWSVLKGGPNSANAQKFMAYVNRAEIAAGFTQTGFPSPNINQLKYLAAYLPPLLSINPENVSPENVAKAFKFDTPWYAAKRPDGKTNGEHIQERWLAWRAR
ncbi:ABC transporter substrate-binding protein [Bradyrhizobium sp. USDA 336]|uniref:ABC transporter substrate-binding protein n=1 Tax=Bradyrhizobium sp. USDA 336 TaxID=3156311 RepID=UPI0038355A68